MRSAEPRKLCAKGSLDAITTQSLIGVGQLTSFLQQAARSTTEFVILFRQDRFRIDTLIVNFIGSFVLFFGGFRTGSHRFGKNLIESEFNVMLQADVIIVIVGFNNVGYYNVIGLISVISLIGLIGDVLELITLDGFNVESIFEILLV